MARADGRKAGLYVWEAGRAVREAAYEAALRGLDGDRDVLACLEVRQVYGGTGMAEAYNEIEISQLRERRRITYNPARSRDMRANSNSCSTSNRSSPTPFNSSDIRGPSVLLRDWTNPSTKAPVGVLTSRSMTKVLSRSLASTT